jgi:hypothetical protein
MSGAFDYINALCNHQKIEIKSDYNKFLVNRFFSYFNDTVMIANIANKFSAEFDNELHFNFYYNIITKKKRFTKWYKSKILEDIEAISKYFNISEKEAIMYKKVITDDYLNEIKGVYNE